MHCGFCPVWIVNGKTTTTITHIGGAAAIERLGLFPARMLGMQKKFCHDFWCNSANIVYPELANAYPLREALIS